MKKIAAIIPAYNEEKTILDVIKTVEKVKDISEIIVISDGSTDRTASLVANREKIKLIELGQNLGKGGALMEGIKSTTADIILLLDADLVGLREDHIQKLILPVISGEVDMTRGYFIKGRPTTDISHKIVPSISGQRALRREILLSIPNLERIRFGVEVALNRYVRKNKMRLKKVPLDNLTHIMKEEKLGLKNGLKARMKMYGDIMKTIGKRGRYKK